MLTPRFSLGQDEKTLTIKIRAPYCSLREIDVDAEENTFLFFCKPYYLRLKLPGNIVDNGLSKSSFDSSTGEFTFTYEKETIGEHFEDLELITKFLCTKVEATYTGERKITVLASEGVINETLTEDIDVSKAFGFAFQRNKNTFTMCLEFSDVFEIDPTEVNLTERRKLREQEEQAKFNIDHYVGDWIDEDQDIVKIIKQTTPWSNLKESEITFTAKELDFLKDLSNIEFNLSELQIKYVLNSLIDILYAYCYNKRSTYFADNSESGWVIVKLAASLSWLDSFESPKEALISAFRRSVIYPLYRNYQLSTAVLEDLKGLMKLGEQYIIRCLIEIHDIFLGSYHCNYVLNNLFIKDYIVYIMKWDKGRWKKYLDEVIKINVEEEEILSEFSLSKTIIKLNVEDSDDDDTVKVNYNFKDSDDDDSDMETNI